MNERANMRPFIYRNSGIDALEREIQQLKTKLEIAESLIDFELTTELEARYEELESK